jgi:hypothetical protein
MLASRMHSGTTRHVLRVPMHLARQFEQRGWADDFARRRRHLPHRTAPPGAPPGPAARRDHPVANSGVPLKVAQTWSGHKALSVLLDTYLGVMHHDAHVAYQRVEQALD